MEIGPFRLDNRLILAPMAGITDLPYRKLCRRFGAALAVAEMCSSNPALRHHRQTLLKSDFHGEPEPRVAQILGTEPTLMAEAARFNVDRGAQIIDINMGCPAKKVCNKAAGSALLRDETRVAEILAAVVAAVEVPVTLKIRTGWDSSHRNAPTIARIAEHCGIRALTVHGRTRACGFSGQAEYLTIRDVKQAVRIPVIANGDIDSPIKAKAVLDRTGADALMIGRAALGRPWIFREIDSYLTGLRSEPHPPYGWPEITDVMRSHLVELYAFYGNDLGARIARKHFGWYIAQSAVAGAADLVRRFNRLTEPYRQLELLEALH
jgi:tRNA-dihydrouridine synthase B